MFPYSGDTAGQYFGQANSNRTYRKTAENQREKIGKTRFP